MVIEMEVEEWKYIKDWIAIQGVYGTEGGIKHFLEEKGLNPANVNRTTIRKIEECIRQVETEDGVKSCITFNIEDLHPAFKGKWGYIKEAEELYDSFLAWSLTMVKDTWGKFIL